MAQHMKYLVAEVHTTQITTPEGAEARGAAAVVDALVEVLWRGPDRISAANKKVLNDLRRDHSRSSVDRIVSALDEKRLHTRERLIAAEKAAAERAAQKDRDRLQLYSDVMSFRVDYKRITGSEPPYDLLVANFPGWKI